MIDREMMEEMRQDMLQDRWEDEQHEIKMRNDDDYFYDELVDKYVAELDDIRFKIENYCEDYGRDADGWFQLLTEK